MVCFVFPRGKTMICSTDKRKIGMEYLQKLSTKKPFITYIPYIFHNMCNFLVWKRSWQKRFWLIAFANTPPLYVQGKKLINELKKICLLLDNCDPYRTTGPVLLYEKAHKFHLLDSYKECLRVSFYNFFLRFGDLTTSIAENDLYSHHQNLVKLSTWCTQTSKRFSQTIMIK